MPVTTCSLAPPPTGLFWLNNLTPFHEFTQLEDIDNGQEKLPDGAPEHFTIIFGFLDIRRDGSNGNIFVLRSNYSLNFQSDLLLYFIWSDLPRVRNLCNGQNKINIWWGKAKCHIKGWSLYFVLKFKFDIVILC